MLVLRVCDSRGFHHSPFYGILYPSSAFLGRPRNILLPQADGEEIGEEINGKKLAVLGGALFVADLLSGALTGRSVLKLVGNNAQGGVSPWQQELVDKLLEKEEREAAARMGVKAVTDARPRGPSATGDYATSDPFEIAKRRYQKPASVEDLKRELRTKLDGKDRSLGFDTGEQDE